VHSENNMYFVLSYFSCDMSKVPLCIFVKSVPRQGNTYIVVWWYDLSSCEVNEGEKLQN